LLNTTKNYEKLFGGSEYEKFVMNLILLPWP